MKLNVKIFIVLIILLFIGATGVFAFTKFQESQKPNIVKVNLKSGDFFFDPSIIHAKVGDTLEFSVTNDGYHTFVIYDPEKYLSVKAELINPNETFTFKVDEAGTFEYYCDVAGHKAGGQKGTLIVEE